MLENDHPLFQKSQMAIRKIVKELFAAIEASDHETVARVLDREPDLSHAVYKKNLPISLAVKNRNVEIMVRILEALNEVDEMPFKQSMEAAVRSVLYENKIELLPVIMENANKEKTDLFPNDCQIVDEAIEAGRPAKFIRSLLDAAIPYKLPLHAAASRATPAVLRLLLERNIGDPFKTDQWGNTPLDIARERRNTEGPKIGQKLMEVLHEHSMKRDKIDLPWGHRADSFIYFELSSPNLVVCDPGLFDLSIASRHTIDDFVPGIYRISINSIQPAESGDNCVSVDFGCLVFVDETFVGKLERALKLAHYTDKNGQINWPYFDTVATKIENRFGFCSGDSKSPFRGDGLYFIDASSIQLFKSNDSALK